jgi:hypothetical protein
VRKGAVGDNDRVAPARAANRDPANTSTSSRGSRSQPEASASRIQDRHLRVVPRAQILWRYRAGDVSQIASSTLAWYLCSDRPRPPLRKNRILNLRSQ